MCWSVNDFRCVRCLWDCVFLSQNFWQILCSILALLNECWSTQGHGQVQVSPQPFHVYLQSFFCFLDIEAIKSIWFSYKRTEEGNSEVTVEKVSFLFQTETFLDFTQEILGGFSITHLSCSLSKMLCSSNNCHLCSSPFPFFFFTNI